MKSKLKSRQRGGSKSRAISARQVATVAGDATYDERVGADRRAAQQESIASFLDHIKSSKAATIESVEQGKLSINELRLAGLDWMRASERGQFDMAFYNQVALSIKPADRKYMTAEVVKTALHFARLEKPVSTPGDAAQHIQKVLFTYQVTEKPFRQLAARATQINWGELLPVEIGKLNSFLKELLAAEPMDSWSRDRLETVEAQLQFSAELHAAVKARLK